MAHQSILTIQTRGPGLYEFTREAQAFVAQHGDGPALLTAFVRHTSCSLLIQENADPDVKVDLQAYISRLAPRADDASMNYLIHRLEGDDDMPAHIRAMLTQTSLTVPADGKGLLLGTWQGMYVWEHRDRPHRREIVLHLG